MSGVAHEVEASCMSTIMTRVRNDVKLPDSVYDRHGMGLDLTFSCEYVPCCITGTGKGS